jgi:hypothetical protein
VLDRLLGREGPSRIGRLARLFREVQAEEYSAAEACGSRNCCVAQQRRPFGRRVVAALKSRGNQRHHRTSRVGSFAFPAHALADSRCPRPCCSQRGVSKSILLVFRTTRRQPRCYTAATIAQPSPELSDISRMLMIESCSVTLPPPDSPPGPAAGSEAKLPGYRLCWA